MADPLASLLTLKRNAVQTPYGTDISANLAEADPGLLFPSGLQAAGSDQQDRTAKLSAFFGAESPAMQQQRKQVSDFENEQAKAFQENDPTIKAAHEQATQDALQLAGKTPAQLRIPGEATIAVEHEKAQAEKYKADQIRQAAESKITAGASTPHLNADEQKMVDAAQGISALGLPLLDKYKQRYPGIEADAQKYGSPISDTLTQKLGKGIYSFGGMTDNDELLQNSAAIEAWGLRALAQGRINQTMMDIIKAHLPQPGFSPGANYDRLQRLLTEVLPSQMQGIGAGHGAAPLSLPQPTDPYANPDYQPK